MLFLASILALLPLLQPTLSETVDYKSLTTPAGDRLPDFSYAGYRASQEPLPSISRAATKTLASSGSGDQSALIQAALDAVSSEGGGVVELKAGTYALSHSLVLRNGTTLRGAGVGKTVLTVGSVKSDVITLGDASGEGKVIKTAKITDDYVGVGKGTVHVDDASGFAVGQSVMVQRAVSPEWIHALGMDTLTRDEKPQTWIKPGTLVQQPRHIASINSHAITLDIPLTDSLNPAYMSPQLVAYTPPPLPSQIGLESLSLTVTPTCSGRILNDTSCSAYGITIAPFTTDAWLRSISMTGFNNAINVAANSTRVTITGVTMNRDAETDKRKGYPLEISLSGTQTLVHNCQTLGIPDSRSYTVATKTLAAGPNAVVGYYAQRPVESLEPHERYAHGFLAENVTGGSLLFRNRGNAGTGHGWTVGNGVAWNVEVKGVTVVSPPLGANWCVGCVGSKSADSNGTFVSAGSLVEPQSLFAVQLSDRGVDFGGLGL